MGREKGIFDYKTREERKEMAAAPNFYVWHE